MIVQRSGMSSNTMTHSTIVTHKVPNTSWLGAIVGRFRVTKDYFTVFTAIGAILLAITFGGILVLTFAFVSSFVPPPRLPATSEITRTDHHSSQGSDIFDLN